MTLYLHVFNADHEEWNTVNIGIVLETPKKSKNLLDCVRYIEFGSGPFKDTPRKPYAKELIYEVHEIIPHMEIYGQGYDRCSLEINRSGEVGDTTATKNHPKNMTRFHKKPDTKRTPHANEG